MKLPDSVYNKLKWLVIIVIPSLTTFYAVLDSVLGWGYKEIVEQLYQQDFALA